MPAKKTVEINEPKEDVVNSENVEETTESNTPPPEDDRAPEPASEPAPKEAAKATRSRRKKVPQENPSINYGSVLTIEAGDEIESGEDIEAKRWHEVQNAYRTRKPLTGTLDGIESLENGNQIAVVYYNGFRVVIPVNEMAIKLTESDAQRFGSQSQRTVKILGNMLGAEIDFTIKGVDNKTKSIVASREDAMLRKRQLFYLTNDANGLPKIHEGRVVQARVIAVAEKVIRVEVFGVETSIVARDLSWDWLGDARDAYSIGDQVLVRILSVKANDPDDIIVRCDVKSTMEDTTLTALSRCKVQGKYAGKVTDVYRGSVFVKLNNGVNAVAHSCFDSRLPGKKDDVSFVITQINQERKLAVGIITKIIKQNI